MQQTILFSIVIVTLAAVITVEGQVEDRFRIVKEINPIARYWAQNRLRRKLPQLNAMAAKNRQDGGEYRRNCFFSPVQCKLPVTVEKDPLVMALNIQDQAAFDRFRRLGWGRK